MATLLQWMWRALKSPSSGTEAPIVKTSRIDAPRLINQNQVSIQIQDVSGDWKDVLIMDAPNEQLIRVEVESYKRSTGLPARAIDRTTGKTLG